MHKSYEIIAETAFSHEGDFKYLISQIEAAREGNADIIKFQIFLNKDEQYTRNHPILGKIGKWMFDKKQWLDAIKYARSLNLQIVVLPLNLSSLEFCLENDVDISAYEVHSIVFNEYHFLNRLQDTDKRVFLAVGGRFPDEVAYAIDAIKCDDISKVTLMLGFQSFPTDIQHLNLLKIKTFKELFKCEVGYADHTKFDDHEFHDLNCFSFLLGARKFEKHIVLKKGEERTDYESAISTHDFNIMRNRLDELTLVLGNENIFNLNEKELNYRNREKQIVTAREIKQNEIISLKDLAYRITEQKSDFEQSDILKIVGKKAKQNIELDEALKYKHMYW